MCVERLPPLLNDAHQILDGSLKVVVHDHVIELVPVGHIAYRVPEATGDDVLRVRAAISEAGMSNPLAGSLPATGYHGFGS